MRLKKVWIAVASAGFQLSVPGSAQVAADPTNADLIGNLRVGDEPSEVNFPGRLWRIPAARLATIQ
jgi:hypothetical protein